MRENVFRGNRVIILTMMTASMLCLTSCLSPIVYGSQLEKNIEQKIERETKSFDSKFFDLISFINEKSCTIEKETVFKLVDTYLEDEEVRKSANSFLNIIYNQFENKMTENEIRLFLTIISWIIQKNNDLTIDWINSYLENKNIFYETLFLEKRNSDNNFYNNSKIGLNIEKTSNEKIGSEFDKYWGWYKNGKLIWDGNFVNANGDIIRNPIVIFNYWKGNTFHDWYYEAADYIWGIQDVTRFSQFRVQNWLLFFPALFCLIVSTIGFFSGFMGGSIEGYAIGNLFGFVGIIILLLLVYNDYYIFLYYLFGSNAFLMLFEHGYVDPIIEVYCKDRQILNSCTVKAYSNDAEIKYKETGGYFDNDKGANVPWSFEDEFNYELHAESDDTFINNSRIYTICYPEYEFNDEEKESAHAQWKKAVPPPGNWTIIIEADGYKTIVDTIHDLEPRTSYHLKYELEEID